MARYGEDDLGLGFTRYLLGSDWDGSDDTYIRNCHKPTHLNSPLRCHTVDQALGRRKGKGWVTASQEWNMIKTHGNTHMVSFEDHTHLMMLIWDSRKRVFASGDSSSYLPYLESFLTGLEILNLQRPVISKLSSNNHLERSINWATPRWQEVASINKLREIMEEYIRITASQPFGHHQRPHMKHWKMKGELMVCTSPLLPNTCATSKLFYSSHLSGSTLVDRDGALMISDILSQRCLLLACAETAEQWGQDHYLHPDMLDDVFRWGDHILDQLGNRGYDVIANWESLMMGSLLASTADPFCDNTKFLQESVRALYESSGSWKGASACHANFIRVRLKITSNPHLISQAYGLFRIWGHPIVDEVAGVAKLKKTACRRKILDMETVESVSCHFKELFCLNYRRKHGLWPNMDTSRLFVHNPIRQAFERNTVLETKNPRYNTMDWGDVISLETFSVDPAYNLSTLISDKALSNIKSELELMIKQSNHIGDPSERRVITKWLQSQLNDPLALLREIDADGFGQEESVIGVVGKEREIKREPRLFALLTIKKRMYVVITEALLADKVLPLFPEITMKDDLVTLSKKMYNTTEGMRKRDLHPGDDVDIVSNMDFEKWNSNMRKEATLSTFQFLDGLFGFVNLFSRTHEMFENAFLYLADGYNIPKLDRQGKLQEGITVWLGHLGGLEGLRQKGWTLFTVAILSLITRGLNTRFRIMAAGDNVEVSLRYRIGGDGAAGVQKTHDSIMRRWHHILNLVGLPIKPSETWSSSVFFAYGKVLIFQGSVLSMSMKKICRMFKLANDGYPTVESSLSSISANISSAIFSDFLPDVCFLLGMSEIASCLLMHMHWSPVSGTSLIDALIQNPFFKIPKSNGGVKTEGKPLSGQLAQKIKSNPMVIVKGIMLLPKILGGYPVPSLICFLTRSFPDPLSEAITQLKISYHHTTDPLYKHYIQNILSPTVNSELNAQYLIQDPLSVNLNIPSSPDGALKIAVLNYLDHASWITNAQFKTFFAHARAGQEQWSNLLFSMDPYHPRLATEMFKASLPGYAAGVVGKVEKTSTMVSFATRQGDISVLSIMERREPDYFKSVFHSIRYQGSMKWNPSICSRMWADKLRVVSWKKPSGIFGVTVPHPAEYLRAYPVTLQDCVGCVGLVHPSHGYFLLKLSPSLSSFRMPSWKLDLGENVPFMGGKTDDRSFMAARTHDLPTEPLIHKALSLQRVVGWLVEPGSNLALCVEEILRSISDVPPSLVQPVPGTVTGSADHRFLDDATKHGGTLPHIYSPASYFHLSTTHLLEWSKGAKNVTVHFQALMIACQACAIYDLLSNNSNLSELFALHFHLDCSHCVVPVSDVPPEISVLPSSLPLKSDPFNPLCYVHRSACSPNIQVPISVARKSRAATQAKHANRLIYQKVALEVARSVTRQEQASQAGGKIGSTATLPISWTFRLDPVKLMEACSIALLAQSLYFCSFFGSGEEMTEDAITRAVHQLGTIPPHCFAVLGSFLAVPQARHRLAQSHLNFSLPSTIPLKPHSIHQAAKDGIIAIASSMTRGELRDPSLWSKNYTPFFEDLSSSRFVVFLRLTEQLLFDRRQSQESFLLQFSAIRVGLRLIPPQTNVHTLDPISVLKWTLQKANELEMPVKISNGIGWFLSNNPQWEPSLHMETSDYLSRLITPYRWSEESALEIDSKTLTSEGCVVLTRFRGQDVVPNMYWDIPPTPALPTSLTLMHSLRLDFNNTSAGTKWYTILHPHRVRVSRSQQLAMMGDGTGGVSFLLTRMNKVGKLYFNTLIDTDGIVPHSLTQTTPAAFDHAPASLGRLHPLCQTLEGPTDITDKKTITRINNLHPEGFDFVGCDAEGEGPDKPAKAFRIGEGLMKIANPRKSMIIMKTYMSNWELTMSLVSMFLTNYKDVQVVVSKLTSARSTEIFLVCTERRSEPLGLFQYRISRGVVSCRGLKLKDYLYCDGEQIRNQALDISYSYDATLALEVAVTLSTPWTSAYGRKKLLAFYPNIEKNKVKFPETYFQESYRFMRPLRLLNNPAAVRRYSRFTFNNLVLKHLAGMILVAEIALEIIRVGRPFVLEDVMDDLIFVAWACRRGGWRSIVTLKSHVPQEPGRDRWIKIPLANFLTKNDLKRFYFAGGVAGFFYAPQFMDDCTVNPWSWKTSDLNNCSNFRFLTTRDLPKSKNLRSTLVMSDRTPSTRARMDVDQENTMQEEQDLYDAMVELEGFDYDDQIIMDKWYYASQI